MPINSHDIAVISEMVHERIQVFSEGLEDRLSMALRKALDTVTHEYNERLKALEEDQARILRHLGLEE